MTQIQKIVKISGITHSRTCSWVKRVKTNYECLLHSTMKQEIMYDRKIKICQLVGKKERKKVS